MWTHLDAPTGFAWLRDSLRNGTLACAADGSYNPALPTLSGAGFVLMCTRSGHYISGNFFEMSSAASSFRRELLGLLAIFLILLAVKEYYLQQSNRTNQIVCDNKAAIYRFKCRTRRIAPGQKNADILHIHRTITSRFHNTHTIEHVHAHQDDNIQFANLSIAAKLNTICDSLAKEAVR